MEFCFREIDELGDEFDLPWLRDLFLWNFEIFQVTEDSEDYLMNSLLVTEGLELLPWCMLGYDSTSSDVLGNYPWKGELSQFVLSHDLFLKPSHLCFYLLHFQFLTHSHCPRAAQRTLLTLGICFLFFWPDQCPFCLGLALDPSSWSLISADMQCSKSC